jgi:hypothetical protein
MTIFWNPRPEDFGLPFEGELVMVGKWALSETGTYKLPVSMHINVTQ